MTKNNTIVINYSDSSLRVLVEEYITQQRSSFTLKGACSYVLYWAMETNHTAGEPFQIYESDQLQADDCDRVRRILDKIAGEGRLLANGECFEKIAN